MVGSRGFEPRLCLLKRQVHYQLCELPEGGGYPAELLTQRDRTLRRSGGTDGTCSRFLPIDSRANRLLLLRFHETRPGPSAQVGIGVAGGSPTHFREVHILAPPVFGIGHNGALGWIRTSKYRLRRPAPFLWTARAREGPALV